MCDEAQNRKSLCAKVFLPVIFFTALLAVVILMNLKVVDDVKSIHEKYEAQNIQILAEISKKNPNIEKISASNSDFMKEFYSTQSDWLNLWMMLVTAILAIMGVVFPIIFADTKDKAEKAFEKIEQKAQKTLDELDTKAGKTLENIDTKSKELDDKIEAFEIKINEHDNCITQAQGDIQAHNQEIEKLKKELFAKMEKEKNLPQLNKKTKANDTLLDAIKLFENRNYKEALELLDKAAKLTPNNAKLHQLRGIALNNLNKTDEALKALKKSTELNPDDILSQRLYVLSLNQNNLHKKALASINKAIKLNPDDADSHIVRGIVLFDLDHPEEGLKAFEKSIELNPNDKFMIKMIDSIKNNPA